MYHSEHALDFTAEMANFEEAEDFVFGQSEWAGESSEVFSERELMELMAELLSISNEAELHQFLGKLFKRAWHGIKKVGSFVGKVARPLGGIFKAVGKVALPFVGGALGSFIPIPSVGTAIGSALGGAISKVFEADFQGMEAMERDFAIARQLAGTAAKQATMALPDADPSTTAQAALTQTAAIRVPTLNTASRASAAIGVGAKSGRWSRRNRNIIVLNA